MRILLGSVVLIEAAAASAAPERLTVSSDAFDANAAIPVQYTCDGAAKAPTIRWSALPAGTKTVAILVDDPDAARGPFTHMLVTNLPPDRTSLDLSAAAPSDASVALNDTGAVGYLAPCPKDGVHHYRFRVFALGGRVRKVPATHSVSRASFLRGISGHVLSEGELVGTYQPR